MRNHLLLALGCFALCRSVAAEPIRVLTFEIEPFFFLKDGQPAGIDYEILNYFAKAQSTQLQIRWVDAFGDLIPKLQRGEADVVAAGMTITPARESLVDFSAPYFPSQLRLIDRKESPVQDLESLSGAKVGVLRSSIAAEFFVDRAGVHVVEYEGVRELYSAVARGEVRAIASETANAFYRLQEFKGLRVGLALRKPEHYGFAVRKGSPLKKSLSEHIERLKASGIYFRVLQTYLGEHAAEVVRAGRK